MVKKIVLFLSLCFVFSKSFALPNEIYEKFSLNEENIVIVESEEDVYEGAEFRDLNRFHNYIISQLNKNGDFVIYANKKLLKKECYAFFSLYEKRKCDGDFKKHFWKAFESKFLNEQSSSKIKSFYNKFLILHELGHYLIKDKGYDYKEQEVRSDLIALQLLWEYYDIDFRNEAYLLRKLHFFAKSDMDRKYYPLLKKWKLIPKENLLNNIEEFLLKKNIKIEKSVRIDKKLYDFQYNLFNILIDKGYDDFKDELLEYNAFIKRIKYIR